MQKMPGFCGFSWVSPGFAWVFQKGISGWEQALDSAKEEREAKKEAFRGFLVTQVNGTVCPSTLFCPL